MKIFILLLVFVFSFSACASKNAFDAFNFAKKEQLSIEQMQSSKIRNAKSVTGVVTALYLNDVMKKEFYGDDYFYISLFIQDTNSSDIQFLLNSKKPLEVTKLTNKNRFTKLTSINATWLQYYLVRFKKEKGVLQLQVKANNNSSRLLLFHSESVE